MVRRGLETNTLTTPIFLNNDLTNDFAVLFELLDKKFDNLDRVTSGLKNSDKLLYDNALLDGAKNLV